MEPPVAPARDGGREEVEAVARQVATIVRRATGDPRYRVLLFGSWVMGRASERSDIDVAITGPEPVDPVVMGEVREACEALPTLYTVDLVDLGTVSEGVREVALAHGVTMEPV